MPTSTRSFSNGSRRSGAGRARWSALPGGLTNRNYKVTTPDGFLRAPALEPVVRPTSWPSTGGPSTRTASAPRPPAWGRPSVEFLPEDGVLVIGFLVGESPDRRAPPAAGDPAAGGGGLPAAPRRRAVRQPVRHVRGPGQLPRTGAGAAASASRRGTSTTLGTVGRIRDALSAPAGGAPRPCNNDLLAENFILTPSACCT